MFYSFNNLCQEAVEHQARANSIGAVGVDILWIDTLIKTLKAQNLWNSLAVCADPSFGVVVDDSNRTSKMLDLSGNDWVSPTTAAQPIYYLNGGSNDKARIVFDNADDWLHTTSGVTVDWDTSNYTWLVVAKKTTTVDDYGGLLSTRSSYSLTGTDDVSWVTLGNGPTFASPNVLIELKISGSNPALNLNTGYNPIAGPYKTFFLDKTTPTARMFMNGTLAATFNTNIGGGPSGRIMTTGRWADTTNGWGGDIPFRAAFSGSMTTTQRQIIETLIKNHFAHY